MHEISRLGGCDTLFDRDRGDKPTRLADTMSSGAIDYRPLRSLRLCAITRSASRRPNVNAGGRPQTNALAPLGQQVKTKYGFVDVALVGTYQRQLAGLVRCHNFTGRS